MRTREMKECAGVYAIGEVCLRREIGVRERVKTFRDFV